ncbi:uncharacterized protein Pyn_35980 [Prunus yedoensis var. nudiflora]|uniref:Large ribosomal subunit protein bL25 beta domain-containing protein n=1 Tax=Prunus yedoensis var. nudiflora TaxID=2094558 RepID=A0A314ZIG0_PRUYE|nr:uncharacterized protein Pyn_35980 [Prunus yedoensis var. nudiflora]
MANRWRSAGGSLRAVLQNPSSRQQAPFQSFSALYHTIQAIPRECTGNRVSVKDRAQGRIPAVVFSQELNPSTTTVPLQIRAGSGSSDLLESGNVLPIKIHRDEESGKILNLVFVWADEGSQLKVDVPVVFKGEDVCPGLKKGGHLNKIRTILKYLCPAEHIPPKIEVDVSKLDIGDRVFIPDVEVHPSMKLLSKNETMPICKIVATKLENPESAGV